jgi:transposase-like protein
MQLARLFCPNRRCKDYRKTGIKNISIIGRYGKSKRRLLRCKTCGFRFSERRWTIFFGLHTDESTIKETLISLLGGKSIRETADEVGLDKDTVHRIWRRVVEHWERAVEEFLEEMNLQDLELKDLFSFPPENIWRAGINRRKKMVGDHGQ